MGMKMTVFGYRRIFWTYIFKYVEDCLVLVHDLMYVTIFAIEIINIESDSSKGFQIFSNSKSTSDIYLHLNISNW